MILYCNNIKQFVKIDPNKDIHSIRNDENVGKRTDMDGNHIWNPIKKQEDIIAI